MLPSRDLVDKHIHFPAATASIPFKWTAFYKQLLGGGCVLGQFSELDSSPLHPPPPLFSFFLPHRPCRKLFHSLIAAVVVRSIPSWEVL